MLFTEQVLADSWQSAVASKVTTAFDTNPSMSPIDPGGVWRVLYEPSYELTGKDGENEFRAGLGLQIERSSNAALSSNRDSPNLNLDWLRESGINTFGMSYKFSEIAVRNAGVDASGQGINGTSASHTLSGTWSSALSERSKLSVNGSQEAVTYKGTPFVDYELQRGGLRYSYDLSERTTPFVKVSEDRYMPSGGGSSIRLPSALLGLELKAEDIDWTMQAGRFRDSEGNSGPLGSVEAHFIGEKNELILNAGLLVFPSGLGGFVKGNQKKVSWSYVLSEVSNAGIDLEKSDYHYLEKSDIPSVALRQIDNSTTVTGAWIERDLSFFWKMRTYYQHRMNRVVGADGAFSNVVGISFGYVNPDF